MIKLDGLLAVLEIEQSASSGHKGVRMVRLRMAASECKAIWFMSTTVDGSLARLMHFVLLCLFLFCCACRLSGLLDWRANRCIELQYFFHISKFFPLLSFPPPPPPSLQIEPAKVLQFVDDGQSGSKVVQLCLALFQLSPSVLIRQ